MRGISRLRLALPWIARAHRQRTYARSVMSPTRMRSPPLGTATRKRTFPMAAKSPRLP